MPSSSDEDYYYDSESDYSFYDSEDDDQLSRKIFGKSSANTTSNRSKQVYCAICAGKHTEVKCPNKVYSKSRQFNNVREKFAAETKF